MCLEGAWVQEPPKCNVCGVSGKESWGRLSTQQRNYWSQRGNELVCRKCAATSKTRKDLLNEEQARMKKLKDKLYPKVEHHATLKKIKSGEGWLNTQSFYESWRPASFLAPIVNFTRKATGTPQDMHAPAAGPLSQPIGAQQGEHATSAMARQLEEIQEDLMVVVEEESICGTSESGLEGVQEEAAASSAEGQESRHTPLAAPSSRRLCPSETHAVADDRELVKRDDTANGEHWPSATKIDARSISLGEVGMQAHDQLSSVPEQVAVNA